MYDQSLLSANISLLGSLFGKTSKNDPIADSELLDEQDPVRKTLEAIGTDVPCKLHLHLADGSVMEVTRILEIGYGAFRAVFHRVTNSVAGGMNFQMRTNTIINCRYQFVQAIELAELHPEGDGNGND